MKKVLIIANGDFARHFLSRINKLKDVIHEYHVIAKSDTSVPEALFSVQNFKVEIFDSTSIERLKIIIGANEFDRCILMMDDEFDTKITLENLKSIAPSLELYVADFWGMVRENKDEKHIKMLNILALNSSRFMGCLPDSPVFAVNVGLGRGEIMEVKVPIGSSFAYKKVGMLSSKRYKIPMIYRHNNYIITARNTTIYPNDTLLVTGEPSALRAVYAEVKKQNGQFPSPFGVNILAIIDMKRMDVDAISRTLRAVEFLDAHLQNRKIYLRVINPVLNDSLEQIKFLRCDEKFEILIEYKEQNLGDLSEITSMYKIGLIVCAREIFEKNKSLLQSLELPVLSLGNGDLERISRSVVISDGTRVDGESSVVFDISSQLGLNVYLYVFGENGGRTGEFAQNYVNLSKLFLGELIINDDTSKNPILSLIGGDEFLQFIPFSDKILGAKIAAIFKKDLDKMYFKLNSNHQIFLPCDIKGEK